MKILHCVESYYPALGGMQEVVKQLSERLVGLGHEVTVVTRKHPERKEKIVNGVNIIDFEIGGSFSNGITGEKLKYENFLLESNYDIVSFFAAQQWATDVALPLLPNIRGKKVSVPTGYSGLYLPQFKDYFDKMKSWIHGYDMNVYLSDNYRDINFARENKVSNICIITNGAGEDEFSPESKIDVRRELGLNKDGFLILHVGSFSGRKGHQEATEIFLNSQIKNATLLMIGNNYENYQKNQIINIKFHFKKTYERLFCQKRIICNYFNRAFTVAAYKQADLFLFPSNIECSPIVLFECAAAGLPFLSTDVGNSREIAGWTGGGEILPTVVDKDGFSFAKIHESVEAMNKLFNDEKRRSEMSAHAHKIWKEKYSWEKIARQYEQLYLSLLVNGNGN